MKRLVAFFEIPCVDFKRAIAFYESVFNVKLDAYDCGEEKMAFFSEGESGTCGAISWAKDFRPSKDGVLVSLCCEDMVKTIESIEKSGGQIITPRTRIEADDRGYFSVFIDCEGNRLGLWSEK